MLTESMEDYLEMIYRLVKVQGYVRSVDLVEALDVQASSITKMIQKLNKAGFIKYEKYRNISLTPLGTKYGAFLVWRDATLKDFLKVLRSPAGIDEQVEGMEHYITPTTMEIIASLVDYLKSNPQCMHDFHNFQNQISQSSDCSYPRLRAWEFRH